GICLETRATSRGPDRSYQHGAFEVGVWEKQVGQRMPINNPRVPLEGEDGTRGFGEPSHTDATFRIDMSSQLYRGGCSAANRKGGRTSTLKMAHEGRISTSDMARNSSTRIELLQGTLDMLILRILLFRPAHGHQIAKHIQSTTVDILQVEHGSLYPALHRLERRGWVTSKWEIARDRN